jgi:preprotein translocase subunit SecE
LSGDEDLTSVSDAIKAELREAESPPGQAQSAWARLALAVTKFLAWVTRPEAMTAYATVAAAVAAFLALRAADRQEKATFTSALYAKQVDTLASLEAKSNLFAKFIFPYMQEDKRRRQVAESLKKLPPELGITGSPNPLSSHAVEISAAADELVNAAFAAEIVYPTEASSALEQVLVSTFLVEAATLGVGKFWQSHGTIGRLLDDNTDDADLKRIEDALGIISRQIAILRKCATPMLQSGKYVEGPAISGCLKPNPSGQSKEGGR